MRTTAFASLFISMLAFQVKSQITTKTGDSSMNMTVPPMASDTMATASMMTMPPSSSDMAATATMMSMPPSSSDMTTATMMTMPSATDMNNPSTLTPTTVTLVPSILTATATAPRPLSNRICANGQMRVNNNCIDPGPIGPLMHIAP